MRSISVTTRLPRRGERRGGDYHFISLATFQRMRRTGQLLEWARVHGAYYGTPRPPVIHAIARGRDVLLSIDVQGACQVRRLLGGQAVLIFLLPQSLHVLKQRLVRRRTDSPAAIRARLQVARREFACVERYDYVLVNHHLEETVDQLEAIVMTQRCRVKGSAKESRWRMRR